LRPFARRIVLVVLCLFAVLPAADAKVFDPTVFTLDNGMQVVVVSNHRAPIVTQMVWYKVGAADEPPAKGGMAHFLEHLMFKATKNHPAGEFSDVVSRYGGQDNAFTTQDYTAYYETVASDRLELMMQYEADRMANLVIDPKLVEPERQVVLEERRMRTENQPSGRLYEMSNAVQWLNHPYRLPVIGWKHEIEAITVDDLRNFYETWYAPNNAILIVVGDVEPEAVRALAEKYYGAIPARPVPPRDRLREPEQKAPRQVELASDQVGQSSVSITYLAPSYRTAEGDEAYALDVLGEVLSGTTSRLYRDLVVDRALATSVGAGYDGNDLDWSTFGFYAAPRQGVELETVEAALREEIARIKEKGVEADEVERAKQRLIDGAVFARDEVGTAAQVLGRALATGSSVDDVESWPERIKAVQPEAVAAAARRILDDDSSVTSRLRATGDGHQAVVVAPQADRSVH